MRFTKVDKYGHNYTNEGNCRNIWSNDDEHLEGVYFKDKKLAFDGKHIDKLAELEDIEEELGIDLLTYFKIINATHIYTRQGKCNVYKIETRRKAEELCIVLSGKWIGCDQHNELVLPFSSYGTKFALTKEELEDESGK